MNLRKNKIGILGGSFDPAHKGHLAISKEALKRFNLKYIDNMGKGPIGSTNQKQQYMQLACN